MNWIKWLRKNEELAIKDRLTEQIKINYILSERIKALETKTFSIPNLDNLPDMVILIKEGEVTLKTFHWGYGTVPFLDAFADTCRGIAKSLGYWGDTDVAEYFPTDTDWQESAANALKDYGIDLNSDDDEYRHKLNDLTIRYYKTEKAVDDNLSTPDGMCWQYEVSIDNPLPDGVTARIEVKHDK